MSGGGCDKGWVQNRNVTTADTPTNNVVMPSDRGHDEPDPGGGLYLSTSLAVTGTDTDYRYALGRELTRSVVSAT